MSTPTVRLKHLFSSIRGGSWGVEPDDGEIALPCIRATDFDYQHLRIDMTSAPLRGFLLSDVRSKAARSGDIIIEKSGGGEQQPVGRAVLCDSNNLVMPTNFAGRLRTAKNVEPRFACYLLASLYLDGRSRAAVKQTTGIQNLDLEALLNERVWCPTNKQQVAIADFLDTETGRIDALLDARRKMLAVLGERRAGVIHDGVRGNTIISSVASDIPWLDVMPAHWSTAKLNLIAGLGSGHTPSREHQEWWIPEECTIPWITTGEVRQMRSDRIEYITETREKVSDVGVLNSAAVVHPAGTVVLCRTASAGYSAIMGVDMATSQDFVTWTCGPLLRPRFLLLCLRVMRPDLLERLAMGSTHKTIYMPDIESIRIPLPPLEEQDQIVDQVWQRLHVIDRAVDAVEQQNAILRERRRALITAAVTDGFDVVSAA